MGSWHLTLESVQNCWLTSASSPLCSHHIAASLWSAICQFPFKRNQIAKKWVPVDIGKSFRLRFWNTWCSQRHGITKLGTLQSTYPVISTVNGEGQNMERTHLRHHVVILALEWTADTRLCSIELLPICSMSSSPVGEYWSTTGQFRPVGAQTFPERLRQTTQRKVSRTCYVLSLGCPKPTSKFRSSNITPSHQPCPSKQYHHHMCNSPNLDQHSADLKSALQVSMVIFKMACMQIWTNRQFTAMHLEAHQCHLPEQTLDNSYCVRNKVRLQCPSHGTPAPEWRSCGPKCWWKKNNKTNIMIKWSYPLSFMM